MTPVITQPWCSVSWNMRVTVSATTSLSGTFFCVMTTHESLPRIPMLVIEPSLIALKAYSVRNELKSRGGVVVWCVCVCVGGLDRRE